MIDSGFDPSQPSEFPGDAVEFYRSEGFAGLQLSTVGRDLAGPLHPHGHGTQVTSVIAAVNDESKASGVLNSLVSPDEPPFRTVVYGWLNALDTVAIHLAFDQIKTRGDIDVVNLSLTFQMQIEDLVRALRGRTLVVAAAGNDGVRRTDNPASLASTEPNVMAVGAVAVANLDGSGETADQRARFQGSAGAGGALHGRCDPTDAGPVAQEGRTAVRRSPLRHRAKTCLPWSRGRPETSSTLAALRALRRSSVVSRPFSRRFDRRRSRLTPHVSRTS